MPGLAHSNKALSYPLTAKILATRMPTITKYSGTSEITKRLGGPFQKAVFAAAIKSLQQKGNPLRFNNFATNLRELGRMMLTIWHLRKALRPPLGTSASSMKRSRR